MDTAGIAAVITGFGGLLTGGALWLKARADVRRATAEDESLDKKALATAVETVETIYHKVFDDMGHRVDDVVEAHRICEAELTTQRLTARAQGQQIEELQAQVRELQAATP